MRLLSLTEGQFGAVDLGTILCPLEELGLPNGATPERSSGAKA